MKKLNKEKEKGTKVLQTEQSQQVNTKEGKSNKISQEIVIIIIYLLGGRPPGFFLNSSCSS